MVIGEKLWEGKAKTMGMAIKGADADGVKLEYTWMAQLKGMGKAAGVDGQVMFTGNTVISPTGGGGTVGTGLFTTMTGDMAVIKGTGYGKPEMGKDRDMELHDDVPETTMDEYNCCFDNPRRRRSVEGI